jgi:DNA-directed RNA polymerase subunit N (RpoN/RPB10)
MLDMQCKTCGKLLGNKIKFEDERNKICLNPNMTKTEKDKLISELVLNLNLRYCCNKVLMTYKDIIQDIIPLVNTS